MRIGFTEKPLSKSMSQSTDERAVLSQTQVASYHEEGFVVVRGLIPAELAGRVREGLMNVMTGQGSLCPIERVQILNPTKYKTPWGGPVALNVHMPGNHIPACAQAREHPALMTAMTQLLGGEHVLTGDQGLLKTAWITEDQAGQSFYHQDSWYFRLKPRAGCNAWIACDDVGPGAIALAMMPGSHMGWTLTEHEEYHDEPSYHHGGTGQAFSRFRIPRSKIDFSKEVIHTLSPGDAVLFNNFTWHRAEPNRTGRHLFALSVARQLAGDHRMDKESKSS
jgi:phytanoyl-CoA hydroxylase